MPHPVARRAVHARSGPDSHPSNAAFRFESTIDELITSRRSKPAAYIDIDVDLFRSAATVLNRMFAANLIVPGTVIYYDDWGATVEYEAGESRAHVEAMACWDVQCREVFSRSTKSAKALHVKKAFIVDSIG